MPRLMPCSATHPTSPALPSPYHLSNLACSPTYTPNTRPTHPFYTSLKTNITTNTNTHTNYQLHGELILYKGKILLSSTSPLRSTIITELHFTLHDGRAGIQ